MTFSTYDAFTSLSTMQSIGLTHFLFEHLDGYEVPKNAIRKAIQYSCKEISGHGGYVFVAQENEVVLGVAVVNKTGMGGYVTENFLVFIAVHRDYRNQGIGTDILKYAQQYCQGGMALHCKPNDKAMAFFESLGFEKKFIEMRY